MRSSLYTLAGSAATAMAAVRGFNYGSQGQTYESFEAQFNVAKGLVGADDFSSARLYTMIQEGTANTVLSAIPAAIATNTTLLLGLWASSNQATFQNELTALSNAISQYGSEFADLVVGISVGSEDLYRVSPTGIAANSGYGQEPNVLVDYIKQTRKVIEGTALGSKPVGHVDTWNDFYNSSNSAVIAECDFLGLDEYPYYQATDDNSIENAGDLFFEAYDKVASVAGGKPIWITEAGWPTSGPQTGNAVASTENAESFWQQVACQLITRGIDFWWYLLVDAGASPSFGVTGSLSTTPLYDLTCPGQKSSSSSAVASSTASRKVAQATTPSSAATTATATIENPVPSGQAGGASSLPAGGNVTMMEPTVYVTNVVRTTVTTCPAGQTITQSGSTTVLESASVITSVYTTASTVSTTVPVTVPAVGTGSPAASGSGFLPGAGEASTLASSWGAGQTPSGTVSAFTGAATKMGGSIAALALGAVAAIAM